MDARTHFKLGSSLLLSELRGIWDWLWAPQEDVGVDPGSKAEIEAERTLLLRNRLTAVCAVMTLVGLVALVGDLLGFEPIVIRANISETAKRVLSLVLSGPVETIVDTAVFAWAMYYLRRSQPSGKRVLLLATSLLVGLQAFTMLHGLAISLLTENPSESERLLFSTWGALVFLHVLLSLFLPWSPREAIRPLIPIVVLYALIVVVFLRSSTILAQAGAIGLGLLAGVPGVLVCLWRYREASELLRLRVLSGRHGSLTQDLVDARKIHESLFPEPINDGPVRLAFQYQPTLHIGGDFLYARLVAAPNASKAVLHAVVLDVTGHGVTSALTVNRLHGEIERTIAERPETSPGELLSGLNRYLHFTMATHCVYATALCLRLDPNNGELRWASGGHPPALLRRATGAVEKLDSTAIMLGLATGEGFDPDERATTLSAGDLLLAFTDGAAEAKDERGDMVELDGIERLLRRYAPPGATAAAAVLGIAQAIERHRGATLLDDTLLVGIELGS